MKLKRGATRCVFVFKRWVIKIPRLRSWRNFLQGLLANQQETLFWRDLGIYQYLGRFCPVLFSIWGGFMVIMPYARPLTNREWHKLDYKEFINQPDFQIPVEDKYSSFGVYEERVVAIDYGT